MKFGVMATLYRVPEANELAGDAVVDDSVGFSAVVAIAASREIILAKRMSRDEQHCLIPKAMSYIKFGG
jgi:hypothetical protein